MKKLSLYGLFSANRDNPQDLAKEDTTPTLKRFFKLLGRRFWKLVTLNLMMLPMILPLMIALFVYLGIDKTASETSVIFPQIYGAGLIESSAESTFLLDLFGAQTMIPVYQSTATYVIIAVCIAFLVLTFGWQNVGATYILRALVRGDVTFLLSDYFYAVKKNLKQGFFLGLLDAAVLFLIGFDFLYFWGLTGSFWNDVMFFAVCAIAILYFFMRFYIYLLQITFRLSVRKILKNSLIFVTLGIKRNLMAVVGMVILSAINIALISAFLPINFAVPLILPFLHYFSFCAFMSAYAAYPVIERYMIAPFENKAEEDFSPSDLPSSDTE